MKNLKIDESLIGQVFISNHRYGGIPRNVKATVTDVFTCKDGNKYVCINIGAYALTLEEFHRVFDKPGDRNLLYEIDDDSEIYLRHNKLKTTDVLLRKIAIHAKRFLLKNPKICAYYTDWEDFCSDWCNSLGYTRVEARKILHGSKGEFMILPDGLGIIRFEM